MKFLSRDFTLKEKILLLVLLLLLFGLAYYRFVYVPCSEAISRAQSEQETLQTDLIVSLAKETARTGEPILRNLEYNYPGLGYAAVNDEFMMGGDLLVAPVVEKGAATRSVVLPPGEWFADDGKSYSGPATVVVDAPRTRIPHFVLKR